MTDDAAALDLTGSVTREWQYVPPTPEELWGSTRSGVDWDAAPTAQPVLTSVASVTAEPIEWLWEGMIPQAALVLFDGHPDTGKSTITLDLASRLSQSRRMPDGSRGIEGNTILLSAEDTLSRPIRERLEACEANLERIYGLEMTDADEPEGRPLSFPEDVKILHRAVLNVEAKLVVIDPIMSYLSGTIDSNHDQGVRKALAPLARVASETGCTILMVRHQRKPDRSKPTPPTWFEGGGSSGGFGIVRASVMTQRDDTGYCTLFQGKHNYGDYHRPIDYGLETVGTGGISRVRWLPR